MAADAKVKALESAIVFSPTDYAAYLQRRGAAPHPGGYASSGSHAGRNIEVIYERAESQGISLSLEAAVSACFGGDRPVRHVLVCSGFYVLHSGGPTPPAGLSAGSCETDGPLGALGLVRAFSARGVRVSLFCDVHNGPVLAAAYEAVARELPEVKGLTHCLPYVSDSSQSSTNGGTLRGRAVELCTQLGSALRQSWGDELLDVDCLFALERLGLPYKNIRGHDLQEHTEPVDLLWPHEADEAVPSMAELRTLAGVSQSALSLGVGDGGNEVGMGKVALLPDIMELAPPGFAPLSVNGCHCSCDHLIVATVSNWGGAAFELAAQVLFPAAYVHSMRERGLTLGDLEQRVLAAVVAAHAVDGITKEQKLQVDGMPWEPHHQGLYDLLWALAKPDA